MTLLSKREKKDRNSCRKTTKNVIHEGEKSKKLQLEKKEKEKEKILEDMRKIGLLQITEIDTKLQEYRLKSEKIQALKKQINIIKETKTFGNNHKILFQFSSKGNAHTPEILANNLKKLLEIKEQNTYNKLYLKSEKIKHYNTSSNELLNST